MTRWSKTNNCGIDSESEGNVLLVTNLVEYNMCAAPPSVYILCWRRAPRAHPGPISYAALVAAETEHSGSVQSPTRRGLSETAKLLAAPYSILSAFKFRVHLYFAGLARIGCKISGCSLKIRSAESCKWLLRVQVAARRAESTEFGLFSS
jgi:hypothetical protein